MTLALLPGGKPESEPDRRILAPGAPSSPSVVPLELARHLELGEPLVWWDEKLHIERAPIVLASALAVLALGLVSLVAPEFWMQPATTLWQPLLAICSPLLFAILRERMSRRSLLVTDSSIIEVDFGGNMQRLGFDNIRKVKRDLLRGGLRLEGARAVVHVPAVLQDDARAAIESQRRGRVRTREGVDDETRWLP